MKNNNKNKKGIDRISIQKVGAALIIYDTFIIDTEGEVFQMINGLVQVSELSDLRIIEISGGYDNFFGSLRRLLSFINIASFELVRTLQKVTHLYKVKTSSKYKIVSFTN